MAPTVQTAKRGTAWPFGRLEHLWLGSAPDPGCESMFTNGANRPTQRPRVRTGWAVTVSSNADPKIRRSRLKLGLTCAVHLVAGSTTSSFFTRSARTILARPLVTTSVERFSCQNLVKTCLHSQPGILYRLFGSIRSVSENAFCGVEHHGVNARMLTHAYAQ